jgi:hypothetical protein
MLKLIDNIRIEKHFLAMTGWRSPVKYKEISLILKNEYRGRAYLDA